MAKVWEWSQAEGALLLVMLALADHADEDGYCYPGIEKIAKKCRISGRSVQRHIKEMEERGELKVDIGRGISVQGGATNRYRITVNNHEQARNQGGDKLSGGDKNGEVVTKTAGSGDRALSPKPSVEPSIKPSGGVIDGKNESSNGSKIEEIYAAYPRKVAKPEAIKAITKAIKLHGEEKVLSATIVFAKAKTGQDQQFIPHPATWYNQQRYNDDPETWKVSSHRTQRPLAVCTANAGTSNAAAANQY